MIELQAFGNFGLTSGRPVAQSEGGLPLPSFLYNRRLRVIVLSAALFFLFVAMVISQHWWLFCLLPAVFLPLAVMVGWTSFHRNLAWAKPAQLLASDEYLHRGGTIEMLLKQEVLRDAVYDRIKVQIVMREWIRYTCGTDNCQETFDHIIREHEELGPITVSQNSSLERRIHFELPHYLMHAFHASDNRITWFIQVLIDIQGMPVMAQFYRIDLEPENILS